MPARQILRRKKVPNVSAKSLASIQLIKARAGDAVRQILETPVSATPVFSEMLPVHFVQYNLYSAVRLEEDGIL